MGEEKSSIDRNLWKRIIKDSDKNALSILFRKYYKELLNYGLHLKPHKQLVQDSIQELFYKIWDRRDHIDEVKYVRAYLYSSISRILFRQAEIYQIRNERDQSYADENFTSDHFRTIEQRIISEELKQQERQKLQMAMRALSDRQREATFLKFYSGLTNDEISEVMDVNKQSVYNYIYRAVEVLKKEMDISLSA